MARSASNHPGQRENEHGTAFTDRHFSACSLQGEKSRPGQLSICRSCTINSFDPRVESTGLWILTLLVLGSCTQPSRVDREHLAVDASSIFGAWQLQSECRTDREHLAVDTIGTFGAWQLHSECRVDREHLAVDANSTFGAWQLHSECRVDREHLAVDAILSCGYNRHLWCLAAALRVQSGQRALSCGHNRHLRCLAAALKVQGGQTAFGCGCKQHQMVLGSCTQPGRADREHGTLDTDSNFGAWQLHSECRTVG